MSRHNEDKIIPLDHARGKKERLTPDQARRRMRSMCPVVSETHLLPAKLPYPGPGTQLANIPRHALGIEYVLEMQAQFPNACFMDDAHQSCQIHRIDIGGPHEVSATKRTLVHAHPEELSFPLLKAHVAGSSGAHLVEVANIIADPFGYDVFWHLIQQNPDATFLSPTHDSHTISSIAHATLYDLNFSS